MSQIQSASNVEKRQSNGLINVMEFIYA